MRVRRHWSDGAHWRLLAVDLCRELRLASYHVRMFFKRKRKSENPWIILAIGNPGNEYAKSRHNVGWWLADALREGVGAKLRDQGPSKVVQTNIEGGPAVIAYPKTFVNRSGAAARDLLRRYDAEIERLIVVTDDINLSPGKLRIRRGGGSGGHNGLKSIIDVLQDREFPRIRIGVGKQSDGESQIDHVLGEPEAEESEAIHAAVRRGVEAVRVTLRDGVEEAMNRFNG